MAVRPKAVGPRPRMAAAASTKENREAARDKRRQLPPVTNVPQPWEHALAPETGTVPRPRAAALLKRKCHLG